MMNQAMQEFSTLLDREATCEPDRAILSELTEQGLVTMSRAESRTLVERVARRVGHLEHGVVAVLDGSRASINVLLGLFAASVDVLAVEAGSSHLLDRQSAIWTTGVETLIRPDFDAVQSAGDLAELTYDQLLAPENRGLEPPPETVRRAPHTPDVMLLTSGSTGEPRIVRQSLDAALRGGELYRQVHSYRGSDRILLPVPIAHSFGMIGGVFAGLGAGAQLVTMPKFSLSRLVCGLESGASVLLGSPLLYTMLVQAWGTSACAPRLRVLLSSGGPLAQEIGAAVRNLCGVSVRQIYGSTETGLIACQDDSRPTWHPGSVGVFAPGVEWKLLDDPAADGASPAGEPGRRLVVRTSTMFTGYVGGGSVLGPDGFYETGDLVDVAESGELFLVGRKDTFINVGGKKTNPRRVERIILDHPDVAEVHVFGMAAQYEQAVHAAVVPTPQGGSMLSSEVTAFCRGRLSAHEVPHKIHVLPRLPRTSLGKIDHSALLAAIAEKETPTS
jgi:acyl-coenzyme A synthetase/AMP-(fatty) acid ligase